MTGVKATDAQRVRIISLYRRLEWDTRTVTRFHAMAHVMAEKFIGRPIDEYLDALGMADASDLMYRLEKMA